MHQFIIRLTAVLARAPIAYQLLQCILRPFHAWKGRRLLKEYLTAKRAFKLELARLTKEGKVRQERTEAESSTSAADEELTKAVGDGQLVLSLARGIPLEPEYMNTDTHTALELYRRTFQNSIMVMKRK
jgi:hypothetical protein